MPIENKVGNNRRLPAQTKKVMKNTIQNILAITLLIFVFCQNSAAQDMAFIDHSAFETKKERPLKALVVTELETDKSYRFSCRFHKEKTQAVRSFLEEKLGEYLSAPETTVHEWFHLPSGLAVEELEITLREGRLLIKASDGCCPEVREELKDLLGDIKKLF